MATLGLLLLLFLGASVTVVAPEPQQHLAQESVGWRDPHIKQVLQEELHPQVPPEVLAAATGAVTPRRPRTNVLDGFPPAWPVAAAVTQHCHNPPRPPPTPQLPPSSFSHLRRQAAALDAFRPRLDACCHHDTPLACARHAWTEVLDGFCTDEFGVKTRQFHCCRQSGPARRRCFAKGSAVPAWDPADERLFPPAEPSEANLAALCRPRTAPHRPARPRGPRARLGLRLQRDYERCCRNASVGCARDAWLRALNRFCREEAAVKTRQHRCCGRGGLHARGRCFAATAPLPLDETEGHGETPTRHGGLGQLCETPHLLSTGHPEVLGAVLATCCPLPPDHQSTCAQDQLSQAIATLCATPPDAQRDPHGCCSHGDSERRRCFESKYLDQVTLGGTGTPPAPSDNE